MGCAAAVDAAIDVIVGRGLACPTDSGARRVWPGRWPLVIRCAMTFIFEWGDGGATGRAATRATRRGGEGGGGGRRNEEGAGKEGRGGRDGGEERRRE